VRDSFSVFEMQEISKSHPHACVRRRRKADRGRESKKTTKLPTTLECLHVLKSRFARFFEIPMKPQ